MSDLLSIGKSGMGASKLSLETTGHNISNANSEGYSRQRVHQRSAAPTHQNGVIQGSGTQIDGINRVHDKFVEKRLRSNITKHNYNDERYQRLKRVEDIFNEVDGDGLNKVLNNFYNSFRKLANNPENETIRSVVRDKANLVVNDFNRIDQTLTNVAGNIDRRIKSEVEEVNTILNRISKLNKQISNIEAIGEKTGDLRDQRDTQVRELSKSLEVNTYSDDKGNFVVSAVGVGTLVTGGNVQELQAGKTSKEKSSNNTDGAMEVYFKNRPSHPVTKKFRGGKLSAMLGVRNEDIANLQTEVNNTAFEFMKSVNAVHRRGYVGRKIPTGPNGNPVSQDMQGPTTGINFFEEPVSKESAAENMELSKAVKSDLSNISTGLEANSPGDNRVAIAISKLQHEKIMDGGRATLEENYLQTIGDVGLKTGKAELNRQQSESMLAQAKSFKERISGVSLDEEAANMVRFQHAFQASAKVIQTAEEMFKTVLGLKR